MPRIGVFICHCGLNIAGTVDITEVMDALKNHKDIVCAKNAKYMCSDPGQNIIKTAIKQNVLDRVIVAACSPNIHELTFRNTVEEIGLNPYQCEIANIREQCSWVHNNKDEATEKALAIIKLTIEKVRSNDALFPINIPLVKKALVIGGGISGIQAALDIAHSGYEVILVEDKPALGGHMAQLGKLLMTGESAVDILLPKIQAVKQHQKIKEYTYSNVDKLTGYIGNFTVKIRQKAQYVDWEKCDGCGKCLDKCPASASSYIQETFGKRHAIYILYHKTISNKPVIEKEYCLRFKTKNCTICEEECSKKAIDFNMSDSFVEANVGSIVVATGYELYPKEKISEYGSGKYKDVISALEFERLLTSNALTNTGLKRPSDGKTPKKVVFIQCAGSRDFKKYVNYCSKICCMYAAKLALLYSETEPGGMVYIFYTNLVAGGKDYEEFINKAWTDDQILYLRGAVSKINNDDGTLIVFGEDTLIQRKIEIESDLVVLCTAMTPAYNAKKLANTLKITHDANGFYSEAHPKLRPLESVTSGFYLAGCGQGPKDIPEAIAQASGAGMKVSLLFSHEELAHDPVIAWVDEDLCAGCGLCVSACTYDARQINLSTNIAEVIDIMCQGCGACIAACVNGASQQRNCSKKQVLSMIDAIE